MANRVLREVQQNDLAKIGEFAGKLFDDYSSSDFEKMATDSNYKFLVLIEETDVLGFVIFLHIDTKLEIIKIATNPVFHRQGVASVIMTSVFEFAKKNGHEGVILEVNEKNHPARELYKKMGFKEIFVRRRYYHNTDDAIIMEWTE